MVTLEYLAALDHLIWLRTGQRAADALCCAQPTVSRNSKKCLDTFRLSLHKQSGEWQIEGDCSLLNAERTVHQRWRWQNGSRLRLDAQHWSSALVQRAALSGWTSGNLNYFEYERPSALLRDGVIDAWLCTAPDAPRAEGLYGRQLSLMPMHLIVKEGHPLLAREAPLQWSDLAAYPLLPLPDGAFPVFERVMRRLDLWPTPEREARIQQQPWFRHTPLEDLLIGYTTPLSLPLYGEGWQRLPLQLPIHVGDVLVVREEFRDHPRTHDLARQLLQQLATASSHHADVVLYEHDQTYDPDNVDAELTITTATPYVV